MRILLVLVVLLNSTQAFSQAPGDSTLLFRKVKTALSSYYDGDANPYINLFSEKSSLLMEGDLFTGRDAIRNLLNRNISKIEGDSIHFANPRFEVSPTQVVLHYSLNERSGKSWSIIDVFEKNNDNWYLVLSHHSENDENYVKIPPFAFYAILALCVLFSFALGRFSKNANPNTSPKEINP